MVQSLIDIAMTFTTEEQCICFLEELRWGKGKEFLSSPYVKGGRVWVCKGHRYICAETRRSFNVKTGTIYEGTKLPLLKWFFLIGMMTTVKKGLSSYAAAREIGVSQPTAYSMMMRIRGCMGDYRQLSGEVQMDEVYLTPKARKKHYKGVEKRGFKWVPNKPEYPIFSMYDGRNLNLFYVRHTNGLYMYPLIKSYIHKDSTIVHDEYGTYMNLEEKGLCKQSITVNHSKYQFKYKQYTTNEVENVHKHLRSFVRSHNNSQIGKCHLQLYLDHYTWVFNRRNLSYGQIWNEGVRSTLVS